MKQAKELVTAIKQLAATSEVLLAEVVSLDKSRHTCSVRVDGDVLGGVQLQAVDDVNQQGCRLYPAIGSKVVVEALNNNGSYRVSLFSEVEEVVYQTGEMSVRLNNNGIVFNGGGLGGLLKLEQSVARWNNIENDLNALKTAFKSWVVIGADGGAALKAVAATWANTVLETTVTSHVANDKVKQ